MPKMKLRKATDNTTKENMTAKTIKEFYTNSKIQTASLSARADVVEETDECYFFEAVISSDKPVKRYHYIGGNFKLCDEILVHNGLDNIDLTRFNEDQLALLHRHYGDPLGSIEDITIEKGEAIARIKMMKTGRSGDIANMWRNDIAKGLSIGYQPVIVEEDDEKCEVRITKWMLYEVSVVGVPADLNAKVREDELDEPPVLPDGKKGVGNDGDDVIYDEDGNEILTRDNDMPGQVPAKQQPTITETLVSEEEQRKQVEAMRNDYTNGVKEIRDWVAKHIDENPLFKGEGGDAVRDLGDKAIQAFGETGNIHEARAQLGDDMLELLATMKGSGVDKVDVDPDAIRNEQEKTRSLGPVNFREMMRNGNLDKDDDNVSLNLDFILAYGRGDDWAINSHAGGVYKEYTQEAKIKGLHNKTSTPGRAHGIPAEMIADFNLRQYVATLKPHERVQFFESARAMSITGDTGTKGKHLLQEDVMYDLYMDYYYSEANFNALGAMNIMGVVGNLIIPRQTGAPTAYSLSETAEVTASDFTIGSFTMEPHRIAADVLYSNQVSLQTPGMFMQNLVADQLIKALMTKKQGNFLNGSGTNNEPLGVMNTAALSLISHGTNGGVPTYPKTREVIKELEEAETYLGVIRTLTTPGIKHKRITTPRFATTDSLTIWNEAIENNGNIRVSNLLETAATKGTGTALHHEISGDWRECFIAEWGDVHMIVDPFSKKKTSQVEVYIECFVDIAIRRVPAFVASKDVIVS